MELHNKTFAHLNKIDVELLKDHKDQQVCFNGQLNKLATDVSMRSR
jgi:hypothetical protein